MVWPLKHAAKQVLQRIADGQQPYGHLSEKAHARREQQRGRRFTLNALEECGFIEMTPAGPQITEDGREALKPGRPDNVWTEREIAVIRQLSAQRGYSPAAAERLGRSAGAVRSKLSDLRREMD